MRLRLSCSKKRSGGETNRGTPAAWGGNDEHVQYNVRCTPGSGGRWITPLVTQVLEGRRASKEHCTWARERRRRRKNGSAWTFFFFKTKGDFFFF